MKAVFNLTLLNMKKFSIRIKWAYICITVLLLWMVIEKAVGLHDEYLNLQQYQTLLYIIPAVWIYILALKDKKKEFF